MDIDIELPGYNLRGYVEALNRATQGMPIAKKNEIFSATAGFLSSLPAWSGSPRQRAIHVVPVASDVSVYDESSRSSGEHYAAFPRTGGIDIAQDYGDIHGGMLSAGFPSDFQADIRKSDSDFVDIDQVLQTRIASYSTDRYDDDSCTTDEDIEVVKERIKPVLGVNLRVPSFDFRHSNSVFSAGLSDDDGVGVEAACADFANSELDTTPLGDACAKMTKYQIRKKRKKDRLAMYGAYETTYDDVVKCHFRHEGVSYCAAFRQHGKVYMSTEFRRLVLDYNLCADSVSKVMSVTAAKSCGSRKMDSIAWSHFAGSKNYPFQLQKGYFTYFSREKKALLEAYVSYFYQIAAVNDRLVFNKTKKGFLDRYEPVVFGSSILVHKSHNGIGLFSWAKNQGKHSVIGRTVFRNELFPYEVPNNSVDEMTIPKAMVKCPYAGCLESSYDFKSMTKHVEVFHLSK